MWKLKACLRNGLTKMRSFASHRLTWLVTFMGFIWGLSLNSVAAVSCCQYA